MLHVKALIASILFLPFAALSTDASRDLAIVLETDPLKLPAMAGLDIDAQARISSARFERFVLGESLPGEEPPSGCNPEHRLPKGGFSEMASIVQAEGRLARLEAWRARTLDGTDPRKPTPYENLLKRFTKVLNLCEAEFTRNPSQAQIETQRVRQSLISSKGPILSSYKTIMAAFRAEKRALEAKIKELTRPK